MNYVILNNLEYIANKNLNKGGKNILRQKENILRKF